MLGVVNMYRRAMPELVLSLVGLGHCTGGPPYEIEKIDFAKKSLSFVEPFSALIYVDCVFLFFARWKSGETIVLFVFSRDIDMACVVPPAYCKYSALPPLKAVPSLFFVFLLQHESLP